MTIVKASVTKKKYSKLFWTNYLQSKFGTNANRCVACGCVNRENLTPVLIQKKPEINNCYIIPLCEMHSKVIGELNVCNTTQFVSENEFEYWVKTEANCSVVAID